jgi:hypothetical protein
MELEDAAVAAHEAGTTWTEFWELHRRSASELFGDDHDGYQRFARRLLSLVAAGDLDGHVPIGEGPPPEESDVDQAEPAAAVGDVAIAPCRSLAALTLPWARGLRRARP